VNRLRLTVVLPSGSCVTTVSSPHTTAVVPYSLMTISSNPKGHYPSPTGLRYGSQVLRFRHLFAVPANEPKAAELQAAEELAISGDLGGEHASLEIRQNGGRGA
jgi:hypothetical protein